MKELSIEQKLRDIEVVKQMIADGHISQDVAEKYFPELKDEDELTWLKNYISEEAYYLSMDIRDNEDSIKLQKLQKSLAWLEKQESYYTFEIKEGHWYKCICDYMLNNSDLMFKNGRLYYCRSNWRLSGEIDERNVKDIGVNGYKSFFRPATNREIEDWLENQGEQKSTDKIQIGKEYKCIASPRYTMFMTGKIYKPEDKFLCGFMNFCSDCFEPIEDSEQIDLASNTDKVEPKFKNGDRVRNKKSGLEQTLGSCIKDVYEGAFPFRIKDQDDWELVKQTPVDKVEPKFKIGDKIIEKDFDECDCGTIIDIKDGKYIFGDGNFIWIKEQGLWEVVEQTEPKFKDGDWIVYKDDVWKVCNISLQMSYDLLKINNEVSTRLIKDVDKEAHLWTINDAKPGDIIYAESKFNTFDFIGVFYTLENGNFWCYCDVSSDSDIYNDYLECWEFDSDKGFVALDRYNFYPATKKQRHLLYQKMKDAGYEWDAEKKELKDI